MGKVGCRGKVFFHLLLCRLLQALELAGSLYYVGSSETLPPPLSNTEEYLLLDRLKQGDQEVKGTLIERNLRLVVYIARKFENTGIGVEDLVSIGTIGLIKAVNTFDPLTNPSISIGTAMNFYFPMFWVPKVTLFTSSLKKRWTGGSSTLPCKN